MPGIFFIDFYNNTGEDVTLTARVLDEGDWYASKDGNPQYLIDGLHLAKDTRLAQPLVLKRANLVDTAPFVMTVDIGGTQLVFRLDAKDAINAIDIPELPIYQGGYEYTALQVISQVGEIEYDNPNYNRMTIFLTPALDMRRWMDQCQDKTLMEINLPGTHNSGTYGGNGEMGTQCQEVDFQAQLEAGVRYFDLQLDYNPDTFDDLGVYNQNYFQNVWFNADLMPVIKGFLIDNPSECIVLCVNRPLDPPNYKDDPINGKLHEYLMTLPQGKLVDHNGPEIFSKPLSDLRGCVVLLRRDIPQDFGLNVHDWADDLAYQELKVGSRDTLRIQDKYKTSYGFGGVAEKWGLVKNHMALALLHATNPHAWYLNFTSCSLESGPVLPWYPKGYATKDGMGLNFVVAQHLALFTTPTACRYGTMVMDFVDVPARNTLIQLLLAWNRHL
ncbi:hypothetical protein [Kitasatospora sp. LaBMicrA B282]|uniref:hypothetical protein n=1 Tax=Kitasatospora sp. LaBMicrA B282 TaxID=3420949 RepID=UPI003D115529